MKQQLEQLQQLLSQLSLSAAQVDRKRGEASAPLFDEQLFGCRSKLLTPCVNEAQSMLQNILNEYEANQLTQSRAEHICEKLTLQVTALQRELATLTIREQEKQYKVTRYVSIGALYQDLAQHQDWERRLEDMVRDHETKLAQCSTLSQQQQSQKQLLALEKRLTRCREAKRKIEARIAFREKKN